MYDMSYSYSQEVSYNHSDPGRGPITFIGEIGMFTDFSQNDCTLRVFHLSYQSIFLFLVSTNNRMVVGFHSLFVFYPYFHLIRYILYFVCIYLNVIYFQLDEDCPKQCTCRTYRTDFTPMHPLSVKLNVNCSNQHLTELPPLPPNTIYLDVSNNEVCTDNN